MVGMVLSWLLGAGHAWGLGARERQPWSKAPRQGMTAADFPALSPPQDSGVAPAGVAPSEPSSEWKKAMGALGGLAPGRRSAQGKAGETVQRMRFHDKGSLFRSVRVSEAGGLHSGPGPRGALPLPRLLGEPQPWCHQDLGWVAADPGIGPL